MSPIRSAPRRMRWSALMFVACSVTPAHSANSTDCAAARDRLLPVQVTYHLQDGTRTVVQARPDPSSGDRTIWRQETLPSNVHPAVFVTLGKFHDGLPASGELWTTYVGKYSHRTSRYAAKGLPRNFDHRASIAYELHSVAVSDDGVTDENVSQVSYKFKSEETIEIGSCALQVVHGESESTNSSGRTRRTFELFFPELLVSVTATDAEPILDDVSTVFAEIKPPAGR